MCVLDFSDFLDFPSSSSGLVGRCGALPLIRTRAASKLCASVVMEYCEKSGGNLMVCAYPPKEERETVALTAQSA